MGYPEAKKLPKWIQTNSLRVGKYFRTGYEPQLLDTQKYDSVSTALPALNAGEVDCRSFCLVLSRSEKEYYILWPSWVTKKEVDDFTECYRSSPVSKDEKLNLKGVQGRDGRNSCSFAGVSTPIFTTRTVPRSVSVPMRTSAPMSTNEVPQKISIKRTEIPDKPWVHTNSRGVGGCVRAGYESQLLDTQKYDSVLTALMALNAGEVDCRSFCFVFSRRNNAYYMLWPSWVTKKEVDDFIERYLSSPESKDEKLNLKCVQERDGRDSSSFAELFTPISTPRNTTTVPRSMSRTDEPSKLEGDADRSSLVSKEEKLKFNGVQGKDGRESSSSFAGVSTPISTPRNTTTVPRNVSRAHGSSTSVPMRTSAPMSTNEVPQKISIKRTEIPQKPWVRTNSLRVGESFRAGYESQLLDTHKYDSVLTALTALNAGEVDCRSFCFLFSHSNNAYYMLWPSWVTEKEVGDFIERYLSSPVSKEETDSLPECTTTDTGSMSRTDASSNLEGDADTIAVGMKVVPTPAKKLPFLQGNVQSCKNASIFARIPPLLQGYLHSWMETEECDELAKRECSFSPVSKEEIPQRSEEEKLNLNDSSFSEVSTTGSSFAEEMTAPSGAPISYGLKFCPDRYPVVSNVNLSRPGVPENPGMTMSEGCVLRDAIPGESVVDDREIQLADLCCDNALLPGA